MNSGRPGTGLYEEATQSVPEPADPTDPGDAADLSTPQGFPEILPTGFGTQGAGFYRLASRTGQTTCPNHRVTVQATVSKSNQLDANERQKSSFSKMLGLMAPCRNKQNCVRHQAAADTTRLRPSRFAR